jgi:hypothetical protein
MTEVGLTDPRPNIYGQTVYDFTSSEPSARGEVIVGDDDEEGSQHVVIGVKAPVEGETRFVDRSEEDGGLLNDPSRLGFCVRYAVQRAKELAEWREQQLRP